MINLPNDKDLYILEDQDGGCFGGGRIFEGVDELVAQFQVYAYTDSYEDPTLKGWTIGQCLENWTVTLWRYHEIRWEIMEEYQKVINYKIK